MSYEPPGLHRRSDAERRNQALSWQRSDRAFFAAGACHILAYEFVRASTDDRFSVVGLQRPDADFFDHVYASDGTWAFDYCGWTREQELIGQTLAFERRQVPGLTLQRMIITEDLFGLCGRYRLRPPVDFAADPRPRARRYVADLLLTHRLPADPTSI